MFSPLVSCLGFSLKRQAETLNYDVDSDDEILYQTFSLLSLSPPTHSHPTSFHMRESQGHCTGDKASRGDFYEQSSMKLRYG